MNEKQCFECKIYPVFISPHEMISFHQRLQTSPNTERGLSKDSTGMTWISADFHFKRQLLLKHSLMSLN